MDEETLRKVIREELQGFDQRFDAVDQRFDAVDQRFDAVDQRFDAVDQRFDTLEKRFDAKLEATEQRFHLEFEKLAEGGRMQFRQLGELYRSTQDRLDQMEKHLGEQIAWTRGAVEALRASLERQDFRSDELGRRITALEVREPR